MTQDNTQILLELQNINGRLTAIESSVDYHIKRTDLIESYVVKNDNMENERYENVTDSITTTLIICTVAISIISLLGKFELKKQQ